MMVKRNAPRWIAILNKHGIDLARHRVSAHARRGLIRPALVQRGAVDQVQRGATLVALSLAATASSPRRTDSTPLPGDSLRLYPESSHRNIIGVNLTN